NARTIALASATYSDPTATVTLVPRKPFDLRKPVEIKILGRPPAGLTDRLGRLIDGDRDGRPGGDAVVILRKTDASVGPHKLPGRTTSPAIRAVDHLLSAAGRVSLPHPSIGSATGGRSWRPASPGPIRDDPVVGPLITVADSSAKPIDRAGNRRLAPI